MIYNITDNQSYLLHSRCHRSFCEVWILSGRKSNADFTSFFLWLRKNLLSTPLCSANILVVVHVTFQNLECVFNDYVENWWSNVQHSNIMMLWDIFTRVQANMNLNPWVSLQLTWRIPILFRAPTGIIVFCFSFCVRFHVV